MWGSFQESRKYFNDARDLCELNKFDAMMNDLSQHLGWSWSLSDVYRPTCPWKQGHTHTEAESLIWTPRVGSKSNGDPWSEVYCKLPPSRCRGRFLAPWQDPLRESLKSDVFPIARSDIRTGLDMGLLTIFGELHLATDFITCLWLNLIIPNFSYKKSLRVSPSISFYLDL